MQIQNRFKQVEEATENVSKIEFPPEDPIESADPNLLYEGWLRLSLNTPNINQIYPQVGNGGDKDALKVQFWNKTKDEFVAQTEGLYFYKQHRVNSIYGKLDQVPTPDAFYFRITKNWTIYYTETQNDMVILGSMSPKKIIPKFDTEECFQLNGESKEMWVLCSTKKEGCPGLWKSVISAHLGQEFDGCGVHKETTIQLQPIIAEPTASIDCAHDFNYAHKGTDWVCNCNEGHAQSPIALPPAGSATETSENMYFEYEYVNKDNIEFVFDRNIIRMRPKTGDFGTMKTQEEDQIFSAYEIQIHTPAEHSTLGHKYDMEVQVLHKTKEGDFRYQAVLSFLYRRSPGEVKPIFQAFDLINLPNAKENISSVKRDIHPLQFLFDFDNQIMNPQPFSYFKYLGSQTQPPCAENVLWLVCAEELLVSSTVLSMLQDAVSTDDERNLLTPFNGNNRQVQVFGHDREVQFFDKTKDPSYVKPDDHPIDAGHYEKIQVEQSVYSHHKESDQFVSNKGIALSKNEVHSRGLDTVNT